MGGYGRKLVENVRVAVTSSTTRMRATSCNCGVTDVAALLRVPQFDCHNGETSDGLRETRAHEKSQNTSCENLVIRQIAIADAERAAQLCAELGYPVSLEEMKERIAALQSLADHVVYVASLGETVVGWIDAAIVQHLQTERRGEIGGLVVANEYRSRRIGQRLLAHAERWVASRGITQVIVRSRITRESAHRFYLREGYSRMKTSAVFCKELSPRGNHTRMV
jgi:GNAT superfamily N-acetyltransferase